MPGYVYDSKTGLPIKLHADPGWNPDGPGAGTGEPETGEGPGDLAGDGPGDPETGPGWNPDGAGFRVNVNATVPVNEGLSSYAEGLSVLKSM